MFFAPAAPTRPVLKGPPPLRPRPGAAPPDPHRPEGPRPQTPDGLGLPGPALGIQPLRRL